MDQLLTPYRFDHCEIRPTERRLLVGGQPAALGARAFDLLLALVERRDRTVTKNELLDLVWPGLVVEENNLQVQISTLRKVLGQDAIATIPGQGYRFTLRPEEAEASSVPPIAAANNTQSHPVVEAPVPAAPADAKSNRRQRSPPGGRPQCVPKEIAMGSVLFSSGSSRRAGYAVMELLETHIANDQHDRCLRCRRNRTVVLDCDPANRGARRRRGGSATCRQPDARSHGCLRAYPCGPSISHALASTYKGKAIDARLVGRELNVRYLVEGGVRSAGEGFITDIQLIDTGTATQAWSNRLKLERGSAEQDPGALVTPLTQQLRAALFAAERRRIRYTVCNPRRCDGARTASRQCLGPGDRSAQGRARGPQTVRRGAAARS